MTLNNDVLFKSVVIGIFLLVTSARGNAQYEYSLTDTTDNVTFTYLSSELITSDLENVPATTSDSAFNILSFEPDIPDVGGGGGQLPEQVETEQVENFSLRGGDYLYAKESPSGPFHEYIFGFGDFDRLGTFLAFTSGANGGVDNGVLTISEVPEPYTWELSFLGMAVFFIWKKFSKRMGIDLNWQPLADS